MSTQRFAKVLIFSVAGLFAILATRLLIMGGWFNFIGAIFLSAVCWRLCTLSKRLD
jgi:hypothetical protein